MLYRSKDGKKENIFDTLDWLAAMCSHVPNKGEQMVRYGAYPLGGDITAMSAGVNGKNKNQDEWMPCIIEANESLKEYRKNWARLIQKIYPV